MTLEESEGSLDELCDHALSKKVAEPYTWAQFADMLIWKNVILTTLWHLACVASLVMYALGLHSVPLKWWTIAWMFIIGQGTFVGTTAGAHRLWSHRSYKANLPLRILLMILYSFIGLYTIFEWARDHRVHHKYTETDADPYNAKRGFIFSHIGWFNMKRHPEFIRRGREVDMSDVLADPVAMFQKKWATELKILFCFLIPTAIPVLCWDETIMHAVLTQCVIRYMVVVNCVFTINSFAHLWGDRPYNRHINPAENLFVSVVAFGEGSHNYHHTFPWDYRASESPSYLVNVSALFIDAFAKLGWATDLRKPSPEFVEKVVQRIGLKSHDQ